MRRKHERKFLQIKPTYCQQVHENNAPHNSLSGKSTSKHIQLTLHTTENRKINKKENTKGAGCGERRNILHCWWECELVQPLCKTVWRFLKGLKIDLPYDPAIALLGIYPKDADAMKHGDTCTSMFIAAMSTIAKLWKEPRCPSKDEWIKKMLYVYNGIFLSH